MKPVCRITTAILLGFALFPGLLLFPPNLAPWIYVVLLVTGLLAGALVPRDARYPYPAALSMAALVVAVARLVLGRMATSADAFALLAGSASLLLFVGAGAVVAAALVRRIGSGPASIVATACAAVLFAGGALMAQVVAPQSVAPRCDQVSRSDALECQGVAFCAQVAERRRLFTVERVIEWDARTYRATCTYTGWGGVLIGTARDGGWTDGPIPIFLGPR